MRDEDAITIDVLRQTPVRHAAREWTCYDCGGTIPVGTGYWRIVWIYEGDFESIACHTTNHYCHDMEE